MNYFSDFSSPNFDFAKKFNDQDWMDLLVSNSPLVPEMPSEAVQQMFVGSSGISTFQEPSIFMRLLKSTLHLMGRPLADRSRVLDIGTGWGRFYRWLLRDLHYKNIAGIDVDPFSIELCKKCMPFGDFSLVSKTSTYPSGFDLAISYSILSHLSENSAKELLAKTRSALKSNGIFALTTLRGAHLSVWQDKINFPGYSDALKLGKFNYQIFLDRLANGEHLYIPIGGGAESRPSEDYGQAIIPKMWFESIDGFRLIEYNYNCGLPQAFVVLQKI